MPRKRQKSTGDTARKSGRKALYLEMPIDVIEMLNERVEELGCSKVGYLTELIRREGVAAGKSSSEPLPVWTDEFDPDTGKPVKKAGARASADGVTLDRLLDKALKEAFEDDPEVIKALDNKTLANLIAARAPKPKQENEELEASYLSLTNALKGLPDVEDIDAELRRTKMRLERALIERREAMFKTQMAERKLPKSDREEYEKAVKEFKAEVREYLLDQRARGLDWHEVVDFNFEELLS